MDPRRDGITSPVTKKVKPPAAPTANPQGLSTGAQPTLGAPSLGGAAPPPPPPLASREWAGAGQGKGKPKPPLPPGAQPGGQGSRGITAPGDTGLSSGAPLPGNFDIAGELPQAEGATRQQPTPFAPDNGGYGSGGTDQMFQDLLDAQEAGWGNQERIAQDRGALAQRQAAENAANLGAAVSGGTMAAGVGQAGLKGQEYMRSARAEHDIRREELKMTYLQQRLREAEAENNHARARELQTMIDEINLQIARLQNS